MAEGALPVGCIISIVRRASRAEFNPAVIFTDTERPQPSVGRLRLRADTFEDPKPKGRLGVQGGHRPINRCPHVGYRSSAAVEDVILICQSALRSVRSRMRLHFRSLGALIARRPACALRISSMRRWAGLRRRLRNQYRTRECQLSSAIRLFALGHYQDQISAHK
jgi:hypothetical protein